jgi:hypothetical protein
MTQEMIPERFALLRSQGPDGLYLQILAAEGTLDPSWADEPICFFQDVEMNVNSSFQIQFRQQDEDICIYAVRHVNRIHEKFYYWYLPYSLLIHGERLPILDFQYKLWLPRPAHRHLNVDSIDNLRTLAHERSVEQCERINRILDPVPAEPQTPPRPPPPSALQTQPYSVPRQSPIPNHVAQILIRHARTTIDTCPISLESYDDCLDLSITSCFHIFKTEAIQRWIESNHDHCPVCRSRIENVIVEDLQN